MTTTDRRQTHPARDRSCNYSRTSLSRTLGRSRGSSARIDIPPPRLIPAIRGEDRLVRGGGERERGADVWVAILPRTTSLCCRKSLRMRFNWHDSRESESREPAERRVSLATFEPRSVRSALQTVAAEGDSTRRETIAVVRWPSTALPIARAKWANVSTGYRNVSDAFAEGEQLTGWTRPSLLYTPRAAMRASHRITSGRWGIASLAIIDILPRVYVCAYIRGARTSWKLPCRRTGSQAGSASVRESALDSFRGGARAAAIFRGVPDRYFPK